jgi:hypothetical protein
MPRPQPVNKIVWATGANYARARELFEYIEAGHIDIPSRWGQAYFNLEDDGVTIVGFTNIGWERLEIAAYRLGWVHIRSFIGTYLRWDSKRQKIVIST